MKLQGRGSIPEVGKWHYDVGSKTPIKMCMLCSTCSKSAVNFFKKNFEEKQVSYQASCWYQGDDYRTTSCLIVPVEAKLHLDKPLLILILKYIVEHPGSNSPTCSLKWYKSTWLFWSSISNIWLPIIKQICIDSGLFLHSDDYKQLLHLSHSQWSMWILV